MQKNRARERHTDRDDLAGEHRLGDLGQAVLAGLFFVVWLADTFVFQLTTGLNRYGSGLARAVVGFALLGLAGYLAWAGMNAVFGERHDPPTVLRTGVFGVVRHPVYLGEIVAYLGFLALSASLAAAVVWIAVLIFMHYIARHEERLLLARFGDDYARYMREVGMWWPRLWRRGYTSGA